MKSVVVIPARYKSSRFPGKPLAKIHSKPMIQWVWERCVAAVGEELVFVATDDSTIFETVESFGGQATMTPDSCATGTDRIFEFSKVIGADLYINVQGDEPLVGPSDIQSFVCSAQSNPDSILNGYAPIANAEEFFSLAVPKVVMRENGDLLYMSRSAIPGNKNQEFRAARKQVCVYSFPKKLLDRFGQHPGKTPLEEDEDIEILRFVELGIPVKMIPCASGSIAVDFPEDIERVEKLVNESGR